MQNAPQIFLLLKWNLAFQIKQNRILQQKSKLTSFKSGNVCLNHTNNGW